MLWVIGQPPEQVELARRSQDHWRLAAKDAGFWFRQSGSLTLAYNPLEAQVLAETGHPLLCPDEILEKYPFIRSEGLLAGLHSPSEAAVDPRHVTHQLAAFLARQGVQFRWQHPVRHVQSGEVHLATGEIATFDAVAICAGPVIDQLIPDAVRNAGLIRTQLQMLRLTPQEDVPRIGIHLCAGLTLGHYRNFSDCPSLPALKAFHRERWPKQVENGIHVLVAEHEDGALTVGDSHHYGPSVLPYREESIDQAILDALNQFLPVERYRMAQRWLGWYNTHPTLPYWLHKIDPQTWAVNLFGTGMTLSFGVTEQLADSIEQSIP
jgi:FAD dependent oxidoreductase TIGR03364